MRKIFINEVVKYALIIGISVIALVWAALSRSTMSTLEATLDNYLQSSINISSSLNDFLKSSSNF